MNEITAVPGITSDQVDAVASALALLISKLYEKDRERRRSEVQEERKRGTGQQ